MLKPSDHRSIKILTGPARSPVQIAVADDRLFETTFPGILKDFARKFSKIFATYRLKNANHAPLHIQPTYYDLIASAQKAHEGRLNTSAITTIKIGDTIQFISEARPPLKLIVVSIQLFHDFEKMLEDEGLQRLLPGVSSVEEGLQIYRAFPGYREGEREFGAVCFGLGRLA